MPAPLTIEQHVDRRGIWVYRRPDHSYSLYRYHCAPDNMTRKYEDTAGIPHPTLDAALADGQQWLDAQ